MTTQTNSEQRAGDRTEAERLALNLTRLLKMVGATERGGIYSVQTNIGTMKAIDPAQNATLPAIATLLCAIGCVGKCRACNKRIYWVQSKRGRPMPIQYDALSHFTSCTDAERFRRKGGSGV